MSNPVTRPWRLGLVLGACAVAAILVGEVGGAEGGGAEDRAAARAETHGEEAGSADRSGLAPAGILEGRGAASPDAGRPGTTAAPGTTSPTESPATTTPRAPDPDPATAAPGEAAAASVFSQRGSWRVLRGSGGGSRTNDACERALLWLCVHAEPDGGWCEAGGPFLDPAFPETFPAPEARRSGRATVLATAWGTLAFLARGATPHGEGRFAGTVRHAIAALRARQAADGTLRDEGRLASNEAQALGALAPLEAYGLTGSAALRGPAGAAVAALSMRLPDLLAEARRTEGGAFTLATVFRLASTLAAMRADRTPGFDASALPPSEAYERAADAYLAEAVDRDVTETAGDRIARILARIFRRRDLRRTPALRGAVEDLVTQVRGASAERVPDARTVPYTYLLVREVHLVRTSPAYSGLAYPLLDAQIREGDAAGLRGTWTPWDRDAGTDVRAQATALASWTFSADLVILPEPPPPAGPGADAESPGSASAPR